MTHTKLEKKTFLLYIHLIILLSWIIHFLKYFYGKEDYFSHYLAVLHSCQHFLSDIKIYLWWPCAKCVYFLLTPLFHDKNIQGRKELRLRNIFMGVIKYYTVRYNNRKDVVDHLKKLRVLATFKAIKKQN